MKFFRLSSWLVALVVLSGCSLDRSLDSLVPRQSLAVVVVDHPGRLLGSLVPPGDELPWKAIDGERPWGAAVLPGAAPELRLFVALSDTPESWASVVEWARTRGGLVAERVGDYAVLSTPGLAPARPLEPDQRFDLRRVRGRNQPVGVYIDVSRVLSDPNLAPHLGWLSLVPGLRDQLEGLRLGLGEAAGGVEVTVSTAWKASSPWALATKAWPGSQPWDGWVPRRPPDGLALGFNLPPQAWLAWGELLPDTALRARWSALAPVLGPRGSLVLVPRAGAWAWNAVVETKDPQAVRQALKTLVASGDLQRHFGAWALDPDTAVIYQDRRDLLIGVTTNLALGNQKLAVGYGPDRVVFAGGEGSLDALRAGLREPRGSGAEVPPRTLVAGAGSFEGLGATGLVVLEDDGNLTVKFDVDREGLRGWEAWLPRALAPWTTGG